MEIIVIDNKKYVKKKISNKDVYYKLNILNLSIAPTILSIDEDYVYYEYIDGVSLLDGLNNMFFSLDKRVLLGIEIIDAIKVLNANDIIHKDIKPANIIYSSKGRIYIIDFGASRIFDCLKNRDTELLGTRDYASPEHYGYNQTTYKSDIFSLGKVLIDLNLPENFNDIIRKCTALDPDARFDNYDSLIVAYNDCASEYFNSKLRQDKTTNKVSYDTLDKFDDTKDISSIVIKEEKFNTRYNEELVIEHDIFNKELLETTFIDKFKKYNYCFDRSKGQIIFTIVLLVFFIIMIPGIFEKDSMYLENILLGIACYLMVFLYFCFFIDFFRIAFKRFKFKNVIFKIYFTNILLNVIIIFVFVFIVTVFTI